MKKIFLVMASIVFLMAGVANADDLYLGVPYNNIALDGTLNGNETVGGGSISNSTLNKVPLPFVYCLDLYITIGVPGDYDKTQVTNNGVIHSTQSVVNAGQIAWLLDMYAWGAIIDTNMQIALQAAIWYEEFGVTLDPTMNAGAAVTDYNNMLAALGTNTAPLGNFDWLTPIDSPVPVLPNQALITTTVPEPVTLWLYGFGLVVLGVWRKFRKV